MQCLSEVLFPGVARLASSSEDGTMYLLASMAPVCRVLTVAAMPDGNDIGGYPILSEDASQRVR